MLVIWTCLIMGKIEPLPFGKIFRMVLDPWFLRVKRNLYQHITTFHSCVLVSCKWIPSIIERTTMTSLRASPLFQTHNVRRDMFCSSVSLSQIICLANSSQISFYKYICVNKQAQPITTHASQQPLPMWCLTLLLPHAFLLAWLDCY